ncbi:MAG: hypothetical protein LAT68_09420 [Cyclobacteriaceae bacterium]|nr:hypothetical protein [Cyclobacteriaceae bacterium]MCH8516533.1 hypothetical protein [Cyclobacteriaceae bacterium]
MKQSYTFMMFNTLAISLVLLLSYQVTHAQEFNLGVDAVVGTANSNKNFTTALCHPNPYEGLTIRLRNFAGDFTLNEPIRANVTARIERIEPDIELLIDLSENFILEPEPGFSVFFLGGRQNVTFESGSFDLSQEGKYKITINADFFDIDGNPLNNINDEGPRELIIRSITENPFPENITRIHDFDDFENTNDWKEGFWSTTLADDSISIENNGIYNSKALNIISAANSGSSQIITPPHFLPNEGRMGMLVKILNEPSGEDISSNVLNGQFWLTASTIIDCDLEDTASEPMVLESFTISNFLNGYYYLEALYEISASQAIDELQRVAISFNHNTSDQTIKVLIDHVVIAPFDADAPIISDFVFDNQSCTPDETSAIVEWNFNNAPADHFFRIDALNTNGLINKTSLSFENSDFNWSATLGNQVQSAFITSKSLGNGDLQDYIFEINPVNTLYRDEYVLNLALAEDLLIESINLLGWDTPVPTDAFLPSFAQVNQFGVPIIGIDINGINQGENSTFINSPEVFFEAKSRVSLDFTAYIAGELTTDGQGNTIFSEEPVFHPGDEISIQLVGTCSEIVYDEIIYTSLAPELIAQQLPIELIANVDDDDFLQLQVTISSQLTLTSDFVFLIFDGLSFTKQCPIFPSNFLEVQENYAFNTNFLLAIEPVDGIETYNWQASEGVDIQSQDNQATISIGFNATFPVEISVSSDELCDPEESINLVISLEEMLIPSTPDSISGPLVITNREALVLYSVSSDETAERYQWEVSGGAQFMDDINIGTEINIDFSTVTDTIITLSVVAVNPRGESEEKSIAIAVEPEEDPTFELKGTITSEGLSLENIEVGLYRQSTTLFDTVGFVLTNNQGEYLFENLQEGNYLLSARGGEEFLLTFSGNRTQWNRATIIEVNANINFDIEMRRPEAIPDDIPPGEGAIAGTLDRETTAEGRVLDRSRVRGAGVSIGLVRTQIRQLEEEIIIIGVRYTDESGNFRFNNLGPATYVLGFEIPGTTLDPSSQVRITIGPNDTGDRPTNISATINQNGIITVRKESVLHIDMEKELKLFPNPVSNSLRIKRNFDISDPIKYHIINTKGMRVMSGLLNSWDDALEVGQLKSGVYLFHLDDGGSFNKSIRFIKN